MAGIEIKGFEELRRNTEHICKEVLDRAIQAAEDAAAQVIRQAVEASAPRRSGQLARSIIVYESADRKALAGSGRKCPSFVSNLDAGPRPRAFQRPSQPSFAPTILPSHAPVRSFACVSFPLEPEPWGSARIFQGFMEEFMQVGFPVRDAYEHGISTKLLRLGNRLRPK